MCKRKLESWLNMQTKLDLWKVEKKNTEVIPFPVKANDVKQNRIIRLKRGGIKKVLYKYIKNLCNT